MVGKSGRSLVRFGLVKSGLGRFKTPARCSPEENLMAKGEAVGGNGFRRTGEVNEKDEECEGRGREVVV